MTRRGAPSAFVRGNYSAGSDISRSVHTALFVTSVFPGGNCPYIIDGIGHSEMRLATNVFFRQTDGRMDGRPAANGCAAIKR